MSQMLPLSAWLCLFVGLFLPDPYKVFFLILAFGLLYYQGHRNYERGKEDLQHEFLSYIPPILSTEKYSVAELGMEVTKNWIELTRLQSVMESIREGVLAIDNDGRILLYNHSAEKFLEISLFGNRLQDVNVPKQIYKLLRKDKEGAEWIWKRGKQPNRRYVHCSGVQWEFGALLVLRDVTKLKRLERVRRDFFANVSHELKTPMAIIQAHAEALADGAYQDERVASKFLEALLRNSERLNSIVSSMLDLAHLESGTYELLLHMHDIKPLIEQSIEFFENAVTEKEHRVSVHLTEVLNAYIDAEAFVHILNNFIENAVKYTPKGGTISIFGEEKKEGVRISVCDNGPGINPKYFARVFERFFRIDKGRARDEGGTGLGLSIVRNLADAMGVKVGVTTSELGGAEFWCLLPKGSSQEIMND